MKPNFKDIKINEFAAPTAATRPESNWLTSELIPVKPFYTKEDLNKIINRYDLIIATAGYRSIFDFKRALKPGGVYTATGGSMKQIFQAMLLGPFISIIGNKKLGSMLVKPNRDLSFMKELIESGKIKPVIDRSYKLHETAEALKYYGKGHARGKVIISIEHDNNY